MSRLHIDITDEQGRLVLRGSYSPVLAAAELQTVIAQIRRPGLHQHDASYGEHPLPILAPSEEELTAFINRSRAA